MSENIASTAEFLQKKIGDFKPEIGIVLGTGLGALVNDIEIINSPIPISPIFRYPLWNFILVNSYLARLQVKKL